MEASDEVVVVNSIDPSKSNEKYPEPRDRHELKISGVLSAKKDA